MVIGLLEIDILIPEPRSLKQKRSILKSLKDRLRRTFNISVCEIGYQDVWTRSRLAVACVGTDGARVSSILSNVLNLIERERDIELLDTRMETF